MRNRFYTQPMLLLIFVSWAAGIVTLGWLIYHSQRDSCRTKADYNLTAIADLKVSQLAMWRKERLEDAAVFYKNRPFSDLVRRCSERPQDLPLQEELRTWLDHFQASQHYDRVALFDAAGKKWMGFSKMKEPLSSVTSQTVSEALRSGQLTFTDFYRSERTKTVGLRLFVPILDEQGNGRPLGILMLRIDPSAYLYPLIQSWPTPSQTAETLLIRREGNEAVCPNELKAQKNTALDRHVPLDNTEFSVVKAALGQEGIVEGVDNEGVPVLAAVRAVPSSPWFLVAQMNVAEVYAPMREMVWLTVFFVCALLFGVAGAMVVVYKAFVFVTAQILDPHYQ